jgi:hypothetical protein
MTYTDTQGNTWETNEGRDKVTASNGGVIFIDPTASDEGIIAFIESQLHPTPIKTEADRIAELEAQVQFLLTKITNQ